MFGMIQFLLVLITFFLVQDIGSANMIAVEAITRIHQGDNDLGSNHPIKPKLAKEHKFEKITSEHDASKVILYALGSKYIIVYLHFCAFFFCDLICDLIAYCN